MKESIAGSVSDDRIVYIGATREANLQDRLSDRIDDSCWTKKPSYHLNCEISLAEKEAIIQGWKLEVSWGITDSNDSAMSCEAKLINAYQKRFGRLPSFRHPVTGIWVSGNKQRPEAPNLVGIVEWAEWKPLPGGWLNEPTLLKIVIPTEPGVYRIRAVPPSKR